MRAQCKGMVSVQDVRAMHWHVPRLHGDMSLSHTASTLKAICLMMPCLEPGPMSLCLLQQLVGSVQH